MKSKAATKKRSRRSKEDVVNKIRTAARKLFAERGYAATTTREIARVADVSETLLFRYYGNKEGLFDDVISAPFVELIEEFAAAYGDSVEPAHREAGAHHMYGAVYELFERNRLLFNAMLSAKAPQSSVSGASPVTGLSAFFDHALTQLQIDHKKKGSHPGFDPDIGVRLGFGMIASAVLMRDWLFPEGAPPEDLIVEVLESMIQRGLNSA